MDWQDSLEVCALVSELPSLGADVDPGISSHPAFLQARRGISTACVWCPIWQYLSVYIKDPTVPFVTSGRAILSTAKFVRDLGQMLSMADPRRRWEYGC